MLYSWNKLNSTLLYSTLLYSTLLYSTLLYSTLLYSTLLYSTLLYTKKKSLKELTLTLMIHLTITLILQTNYISYDSRKVIYIENDFYIANVHWNRIRL